MPTYEYECEPCRVIYEVRQSLRDPPVTDCPRCRGAVTRLISAPNLNLANFSSPTEARYARMSEQEEVARKREMQKDYQRIWLPPPVRHDPMEQRRRGFDEGALPLDHRPQMLGWGRSAMEAPRVAPARSPRFASRRWSRRSWTARSS